MAQQQQQNDNSSDMMWFAVFVIVIGLAVHFFFGDAIATFYLWVRLQWVKAFELVFTTHTLSRAHYLLEAHTAKEWTSDEIGRLSNAMRIYIIPVVAAPLFFYGWKVWKRNPSGRFKRRFTRADLNKSEVRLVPWITPVVGKDLIKEPINKGPWAMAKRPLDFARHYRLLDEKKLNPLRTERLFASQLGPLWEGPEKLRPYMRALFACFIAQVCKDKDVAREHLMILARTMSSGKPDYSFTQKLLDQYYNQKDVQDLIKRHAYVTTVLCAVLSQSRKVGVLPPNYFLWLRPIHRSLWYALNGVGRRTPFCEVAGVHAHRLAEEISGHSIERPYVIHAVEAMEKALNEISFD